MHWLISEMKTLKLGGESGTVKPFPSPANLSEILQALNGDFMHAVLT